MRRGNLILGMVFVVLGIVFLLNNLNIITFSLWEAFFDLWPLFFVILGIHLLSDKPIVTAISWILLALVVVLYAVYVQGGISIETFKINQYLNNYL